MNLMSLDHCRDDCAVRELCDDVKHFVDFSSSQAQIGFYHHQLDFGVHSKVQHILEMSFRSPLDLIARMSMYWHFHSQSLTMPLRVVDRRGCKECWVKLD